MCIGHLMRLASRVHLCLLVPSPPQQPCLGRDIYTSSFGGSRLVWEPELPLQANEGSSEGSPSSQVEVTLCGSFSFSLLKT